MSTTWKNLRTTVRRVTLTTAAAGILVATGTGCASAAPGEAQRTDEGWSGPVTSSMFAGTKVSTCSWVGPSVFTLVGEYHCS